MMGPLEWKAYLQECSRQIIEEGNVVERPVIPDAAFQSGWLGYDGAPNTAIWQAEKRLGVSLPQSLRSFYSATNGWRTVGCFIYEVLPVEKIGWLVDADPDLYDLVGGNEPKSEEYAEDGEEDDNEYEQGTRVKRSLVISLHGHNDASTWLLDPETINDKGEWAGGRWSSWNPAMRWIADSFEELFRNEYETYLRLRKD